LAFLLVNTDNNGYLTKDELMEASKVSEDISALNFSQRQLENLVDGLIGIGDRNGDKRITFEEYVHMSHDVFVDNFAPRNIKRVLRQ
jgi:Ca2+-binding EF-hand superfamily protein